MKSTKSSLGTPERPGLPAPDCVLRVGDGRGFVFEYRMPVPPPLLRKLAKVQHRTLTRQRRTFRTSKVILTAAHCLGKLPVAHAMAYCQERTYPNLLGSLDGSKNGIWAECLFVDPVADIAVLGSPDEQERPEQADAYDHLVDDLTALRIGKPKTARGWVLSLEGYWVATPMKVLQGLYGTSLSIGSTKPGMSGSPILSDAGRAVGLVAVGGETMSSRGERQDVEMQGPQPILSRDLPGRLIG